MRCATKSYKSHKSKVFFHFIKKINLQSRLMKKLIINEKNLPKISKASESNIRIRINKSHNNQEQVPKSTPSLIQEIDVCLEVLQKYVSESIALDQENTLLISQLLKQYRSILQANMELMTQSLKFTKLKFKNTVQTEDKENFNNFFKQEKSFKQVAVSDRIQRLGEKSQTIPSRKNQKNRKLLSMHKKTPEKLQTIGDQNQKDETLGKVDLSKVDLSKVDLSKEDFDQQTQSRESKFQNETAGETSLQNLDEQTMFHENLGGAKETHIKYLEEQIIILTQSVKQKTEEIEEFKERIEQLGNNIENLIKKNSQKSEQYIKLQQDYQQLTENIHQLSAHSDKTHQVQELKARCQKIETEKASMLQKKNEIQNRLKALVKENEDKMEQELGRYETAQRFYELARKDLKQQNQNLIAMLEERQRQIANIYQAISANYVKGSATTSSMPKGKESIVV